MKKQLILIALILVALLAFSTLATLAVKAMERKPTVTVTVDEDAGKYRAAFSGLEDPGAGALLRFRFDPSATLCKDPARLAQGGDHVDRVIFGGQVEEAGGTLERSELIGPNCPPHVQHTLTVRLWQPGGEQAAEASALFCLGGCEAPTDTPAPAPTPTLLQETPTATAAAGCEARPTLAPGPIRPRLRRRRRAPAGDADGNGRGREYTGAAPYAKHSAGGRRAVAPGPTPSATAVPAQAAQAAASAAAPEPQPAPGVTPTPVVGTKCNPRGVRAFINLHVLALDAGVYSVTRLLGTLRPAEAGCMPLLLPGVEYEIQLRPVGAESWSPMHRLLAVRTWRSWESDWQD